MISETSPFPSHTDSTGPWDLYKLIGTTPVEEVLHPIGDKCKFPTI